MTALTKRKELKQSPLSQLQVIHKMIAACNESIKAEYQAIDRIQAEIRNRKDEISKLEEQVRKLEEQAGPLKFELLNESVALLAPITDSWLTAIAS